MSGYIGIDQHRHYIVHHPNAGDEFCKKCGLYKGYIAKQNLTMCDYDYPLECYIHEHEYKDYGYYDGEIYECDRCGLIITEGDAFRYVKCPISDDEYLAKSIIK